MPVFAAWNEHNARIAAAALWDSDTGELMRRFPNDRSRVETYFPRLHERNAPLDDTDPAAPTPVAPVTP